MNLSEKSRLDDIAADSGYSRGVNADTIRHSFRIFSRYLKGTTILEMGCAEGMMTGWLAASGKRLTVVEGAESFVSVLRERIPNATFIVSLFEDFEPKERFDNIILGHVLEHVEDPVAIIKRARAWLAPGGRMMAAVPNCRSLHRQAAVIMGLLAHEAQLNEADLHHGHRRVFNPEEFRRCFLEAGYAIEVFGGYWLKPVSNAQIEASWTPEMLDAFMALGERYPDIAGDIYVIAGNPE